MLAGEDGGLVMVPGLATFAWDGGDEAGRRLAAVQLVRLRAASQGQVAGAFGVDPGTIWRWDQALAADGVAGLVPARRGPKGARKLTPRLAERIGGLDAAGATLREIAAAAGVSTFSVRNALGRVASGRPPAAARQRGPRRTQALAALCDQLSQAQACYPGTDLVLRYEIKSHPSPA
jgi:transposase-like protein